MVNLSELAVAAAAVAEAAAATSAVQARIAATDERVLKPDRTPVTVADLAAQVVITARLRAAFPADPLVAEEDASQLTGPSGNDLLDHVQQIVERVQPSTNREDIPTLLQRGGHSGGPRGRFWVLDPIDGTKGFLRGQQYAVALALVEDGCVTLGLLGLPNLPLHPGALQGPRGLIVGALRGQGAWLRPLSGGEPVRIRVSDVSDAALGSFCESVEKTHSSHGITARIASRLALTAPAHRVDGQTKYAIVARGEADIYLRLPSRPGYREKIWDHAAGSLIVEEAGGRVTTAHGQPLDFSLGRDLGNTGGIVVTNGAIHDQVLDAVGAELAARE